MNEQIAGILVAVIFITLFGLFGVLLFVIFKRRKRIVGDIKNNVRAEIEKQQQIKIEGAELDSKGILHCPKCNSVNLTTNQKGYSYVKGAAGVLMIGLPGLLAGGLGAKKIQITCLKCGHDFPIKKK